MHQAFRPSPAGQDFVDDRLDQLRDGGRRRGIDRHRREGHGKAPAVGAGVPEQALERIHSVNRYFSSTHNATNPSRQVIFFPSS